MPREFTSISRRQAPLGRMPELHEISRTTRQRIVVDDETGCWLWQGELTYGKYGPHRRLYHRYVGRTPAGYHIHHCCERPQCCNPAHMKVLEAMTHFMMHWEERIDQETVARIKRLLRTTWMSHPEIAAETGVAPTTVSAIATGQRWGVPGEVLSPPPRPCKWCGELIVGRQRDATYCRPEHAVAYNNRKRSERQKAERRARKAALGQKQGDTGD